MGKRLEGRWERKETEGRRRKVQGKKYEANDQAQKRWYDSIVKDGKPYND
jgi:hypothetical protein